MSDSRRRELLQRLFYPGSIVLVGASERSPWSQLLHANLQRTGFAGPVYAVNKGGVSAHGYPGSVSCRAIGVPVDIAFVFVPAEAMMEAFEDVIAAGIRAAVILTSGFAETGAAGAELQQRLVARATEAGVVILGPNCLGYANLAIRAPLTPIPIHPPLLEGRIALVSQSGATNSEIADMAQDLNVGLSLYVATGNEAMVDIAACVDFLVDDPHTQVIMVFAEAVRDTATFRGAAERALGAGKAIVMLKVGSSALTAQVAAAHTGSLVGDDRVFSAACEQLGVIRVHSVEELIVTASLIAHTGPLARPGVGIVSISGGACTLVADRAEAYGVDLPAFSTATKTALTRAVPLASDPVNPFDITGLAIRDPLLFEPVIEAIAAEPDIGFVGAIYSLPWNEKWPQVPQLEAIGRAFGRIDKPCALVNQFLRPQTQKSRDILAATGIPAAFGGIEEVLRALGHLKAWSARVLGDAALPRPARIVAATGARPCGEREVLDFLAARGVPVIPARIAKSREEAVAFAAAFEGPVALKIASPDIAHKTDVGGVRLNVDGAAAVGDAHDQIMAVVQRAVPRARIEGVLVSPMRSGGLEILVGTVRDPQWGPVLAVGLGGVWVEALADTRLRLLPVTPGQVRDMLKSLRAAKLLEGFRGSPAADLDRLAEVIVAIGDAALALGDGLETLEVNPLWVSGGRIEALDALTVWRPAARDVDPLK
ncbi:MAG: acetate--CoA ligase family protein [Steroidobacteraceae bacterium]